MSNTKNGAVPAPVSGTQENGQTNFQNRFWKLFQNGEMCDVTLIVGEKKEIIRAHKVVLAAASKVFKKYFTEDQGKNNGLVISNLEPQVLRIFLEFVYTGHDNFEMKDVIPVLNTARYYSVPELEVVCEKSLKTGLTEQTALVIFQQAILYGEKDLEEAAKKTLCRFAYNIIETDEFLEVGEDCLLKFIGDDGLTVKSELQVFDALIRWAKAECKRQGVVVTSKYCRSHLEKLIPLIRFPQMDEGDFALKVAHGQIQVLTQEELLSVYFYQKIPVGRRSEVPAGLFNSKPRRYIDDVSLKIRVNLMNGNHVTLDVKPSDTIESIVEQVDDQVGSLPYNQCLTFRGQLLEDEDGQKLLDYNILNNSTLQFLNVLNAANKDHLSKCQQIQISVRTLNAGTITLSVHPSIPIEELKANIRAKTGIDPSNQRLIYSGLQLDNGFILFQYGVVNGGVIHMVSVGHLGDQ